MTQKTLMQRYRNLHMWMLTPMAIMQAGIFVFWALVWTIGPAFAASRPLGQALDPLVAPWLPFFPSDLFWFATLLAYDWKTQRRIHPTT